MPFVEVLPTFRQILPLPSSVSKSANFSRNFGETLIVKRRVENPKCFLIHYLMCITEVRNCHCSKQTSSSDKKEEPVLFELRPGASCFKTSPQFFCRNISIYHWNHLCLNLIVYSVENFRLSWRFIVTEEPIYGREHQVDESCIAEVSKTLSASICKTKSLPRGIYPYLKTSFSQAGGYPGQDMSRLLQQ